MRGVCDHRVGVSQPAAVSENRVSVGCECGHSHRCVLSLNQIAHVYAEIVKYL